MLKAIIEKMTGMSKIDSLVTRAQKTGNSNSIFSNLMEVNGIIATVSSKDVKNIPVDGSLIVVCNHASGFTEGIIVPALIDQVRSDQLTMAHHWFDRWPLLAERMILVDPNSPDTKGSANAAAMKTAIRWVRGGKTLMMFPAGSVAHARRFSFQAEEQPWKNGLAAMIRLSKATVLPVHMEARNSRFFDLLSWVHPRLGTLLLNHEFLAKKGQHFQVRIGSPLKWVDFQENPDLDQIVAKCRQAVTALGRQGRGDTDLNGETTTNSLGYGHDRASAPKIVPTGI